MRPIFFLILFFSFIISRGQTNNQYQNPVLPGFYPDPSVCRVDDNYFLVTSSFEYFPGVPIFHSKDLINWRQIGHCLTRESQLNLSGLKASQGIYAPTIRYHQGRFYMITTNVGNGGNFYVWTENPFGEWSDPIWVNQGGIDPSLYFDDDGKVYLTTTGPSPGEPYEPGIYLSELDIVTGQVRGKSTKIWAGTGGRYPEAPHIYQKDGFYYLLISEGGTEYGHTVTIARSKKIDGTYESNPANPILTHRDVSTQSSIIQGTGHGDLVQAHDGSWWLVHLAFRSVEGKWHHLGRETYLAPVAWRKNDWPVVNGSGTVELTMEANTLPKREWAKPPEQTVFNGLKLGMEWNYLRNPDKSLFSLNARQNHLRLICSPIKLSDLNSPAFIGRRQQHFKFEAATEMDFLPDNELDEAGLTLFMNNDHYYKLSVIQIDNNPHINLSYKIGNLEGDVYNNTIATGPVFLRIVGDTTAYKFYYGFMKENLEYLGELDTRYLSSEVAGGFTGTYIGLFATSNGEESSGKADFDWFEYRQVQ